MYYREHLDALTCQAPGCSHERRPGEAVIFLARCHPRGRIGVSYALGSGMIRLGCMECQKLICEIAVGSKEMGSENTAPTN